jgi:hypothetical protein
MYSVFKCITISFPSDLIVSLLTLEAEGVGT